MTKKICFLMLTIALCLAFNSSAFAQADKGDKELLLSGDVTTFTGGGASFTQGTASGSIGYYFSKSLELIGGTSLSLSQGDSGGTSVDAGLNGAFRYNFSSSGKKAVPYVGFEYFMNSVRDPKDSSFIRPNGGFKYYFKRNVAIDVNGGWGRNAFASGPKFNVINERIGIVFVF